MNAVVMLNKLISVLFTICYFYQFIYILIPFLKKRGAAEGPAPLHNYAVLITARNEEAVISELISSIRGQNYPKELITVFVAADNCTDNTAGAARKSGAVVWERFDGAKVGKGYALDFLFTRIRENYPGGAFDGYFVFDADNLLDENYVAEMNRTFSEGHSIVTSYRNSKNYAANWISAGYSLWFLRESQYLNAPRMLLGTSCAVSGTGFLLSQEIVKRNGGWRFFTLTEDIEFTVSSAIQGDRIAYCGRAVLYDEQPVTFRQSWNQRLRWAKGFFQVFRKYGARIFGTMLKKRRFSCFDMLMTIMPAAVLTLATTLCNAVMTTAGLLLGFDVAGVLRSLAETFAGAYIMLFAVGAVTAATEWRRIHCRTFHKIKYLFTFPIFMFTYIPIALAALFRRVEWKPIIHSEVKTLDEVRSVNGAKPARRRRAGIY